MIERRRPVTDLIIDRVRSGSTHAQRLATGELNDARLAIVIVGGAMAGVGPGGMTTVAEEYGIIQTADGLSGNSGGGFAEAHAATKQTRQGLSIYYEDINNMRFFNPLRLPTSILNPLARPAVDIRYLTHDVMKHKKPLDISTLLQSPIPLMASATDAETGESVDHDLRELKPETVRDFLQAGATLPVLAGHPVELHGRRLYDGGVANTPIAVQRAIDDGYTHILILHNGVEPKKISRLNNMGARIIREDFPAISELLLSWVDRFSDVLSMIAEREANPPENPRAQDPCIEMLVPGVEISMLEKRTKVLRKAAETGKNVVRQHFRELITP